MRIRLYMLGLIFLGLPIYAQQSVVVLNTALSGNIDTVARDAVFMNPGFCYLPSSGSTFTARIDNNLVIPAIYIEEGNLPDPDARVLDKNLNVGTIAGGYQIGKLGAAQYEVPISVPPGTNGMSPQLSIVYNSQSGNGILGFGWHLNGLSSLYRTRETMFYDNAITPIQLNYSDRFELDGIRLMLTSGVYGYNNSIYRLEDNSELRVRAYGTSGSGPLYFLVDTKEGLTIEYGNTFDSRVDLIGTNNTIAEWLIDRVTDQSGNYMQYNYKYSEGEHFIRSIIYTGNSSLMAPYDSIIFRYEDRTADVCTNYLAGEKNIKRKLLRNITVYSEGAEIRNYDFAYSGQFYSQLVEIDHRNRVGEIVNPTIIKWGSKASFSSNSNISLPVTYDESLIAMSDYNLDSKDDFVTWAELPEGGTRWALYTNNGNGTYSLADYEITGSSSGGPIPYEVRDTPYEFNFSATYDYTGDGRPDVLMRAGDTLLCYTTVNNSGNIQLVAYPNDFFITTGLTDFYTADYNGDGVDEVLAIGSETATIHSFNLNKTWEVYLPGDEIFVSDINGDSKSDLIFFETDGYSIFDFYYDSISDSFSLGLITQETSQYFKSSIYNRMFEGDFNGDGYSDFLVSDSTAWYIMSSIGTKFIKSEIEVPLESTSNPFGANADNSVYVRDLNNDYKSDIIAASTIYNGPRVTSVKLDFYLFNGNSFRYYTYTILSSSKASPGSFIFGDFKEDPEIDALFYMNKIIQTGGFENSNLVTKIADGYNNRTSFSYKKIVLPDATLSRPDINSPLAYVTVDLNVVDTVKFSTETELLSVEKYTYANPLEHLKGKGLIDFVNKSKQNLLTGIKEVYYAEVNQSKVFTYDSYIKKYDGTGLELGTTNVEPEIIAFSWGGYTWSAMDIFQLDNVRSVNDTILLTFDEYGNELTRQIKSNGEGLSSITRTFIQAGSWCTSKISSFDIVKRKTGSVGNYTESSTFLYNSLGQRTTETRLANTSNPVTISYEYDGYGNLIKKIQSSLGLAARTETYTYDLKNRFPITINRGPLQITRTFDFTSGNILTETDPGANSITYEYDDDTRLIKVSRNSTQYTTQSYSWNTSEPTDAKLFLTKSTNGGSISKTWYDGAGRVLRQSLEGFNGTEIFVDKTYDAWGHITHISKPYFSGGSPSWNEFNYDTIGRVTHTLVNGSATDIEYSNLSTTLSKFSLNEDRLPEVRTRSIVQNGLGQIISSGQINLMMSFDYNDNGSVQTVTPPSIGTQLSYTYDSRGLPQNETDPDRGITQTGFNGFGEQSIYTNAAGQQLTNKYDILGRDSVWTRPDGTTTFTYYTSGSAKGKISQINAPTEVKKYSYDYMGRITRVCDSINSIENMAFSYEYDSYGRISKMTYPTGYYVTYHYNNYGYLSQIKDGNTSAVIWQCNEMNIWGNITNFTLSGGNLSVFRNFDSNGNITEIKTTANGNLKQWFGYSFSAPTGNLTWRRDSIRHLTERFKYDLHDRLISYKGTGRDIVTMSYDDIGNITSKTDVGEYTYNSQKVHAVESLEPVEPLSLFGSQRISYNYMNLPLYIANDNDSLVYTYGIGVNRIKCVQYQSGQLTRTTWYGDNFERVVEGSTEKFYHWILSPDGPVALVVMVTGGATTTYYLCRDHLNSITGVMDAYGTMQEEYSYDPWGRRRSPSDWSYNITMPNITHRGFTGHEHLGVFELIHMNGRIYDPHIARILNPDPIIQEPLNIQNYNRYSYCFNNPLKYTDPSGYSSYKQYMDMMYGEGNYYYRGKGPKLLSYEEYMSMGTGGSGAYSSRYTMPGLGGNGFGELGFYFDYYSGTYRNTENGTQIPNIVSLVYSYGPNLASVFRGVIFQNGSSWYIEDGPFPGIYSSQVGVTYSEQSKSAVEYAPTHVNDFDGAWGKTKWFLNGGVHGKGVYNIKGDFICPAPTTGIAPTPGIKGIVLYRGMRNGEVVYWGITNNFARRVTQHGGRFDDIVDVFSNLTRNQARGLEQLMIDRYGIKNLENIRNSIWINNKQMMEYYQDAVRFLLGL